MDKERICLSSRTIDIAESKEYIDLTNRLCYYDAPNLNQVILSSVNAEEKAKTLINMPVVAKYMINANGEPTFGGHECYIDEDGDFCFGTDTIGTHMNAYVENDTVNVNGIIKTLPCLFAQYRIWKRNKNVVAAVKRLFDLDRLYSSWELETIEYSYKDGFKTITDYSFLANCLLGYENSYPAYGIDAKGISMSSTPSLFMIAESFSRDLIENSDKEEKLLDKEAKAAETEEMKTVNQSQVTKEPASTGMEESALTELDLRSKLTEACKEKLNKWCWVSFHFPIEHIIWVEAEGRKSELDYVVFSYSVENDEVSLSDPEEMKLTVSAQEINKYVDEKSKEISEKDGIIADLNAKVQELTGTISDLSTYKEKFEEAEQQRIEAENEMKREELKEYALSSNMFTVEELETSEELSAMIRNIDRAGIQSEIADRVIEEMGKNKSGSHVDVAQKDKAKPIGAADIASQEDNNEVPDYRRFVNGLI